MLYIHNIWHLTDECFAFWDSCHAEMRYIDARRIIIHSSNLDLNWRMSRILVFLPPRITIYSSKLNLDWQMFRILGLLPRRNAIHSSNLNLDWQMFRILGLLSRRNAIHSWNLDLDWRMFRILGLYVNFSGLWLVNVYHFPSPATLQMMNAPPDLAAWPLGITS